MVLEYFNLKTSIGLTKSIPLVVLIVATVNIILIGGKQRTMGILVSALHANFNSTMSSLNWIADSYCAVTQLFVPVASTIILFFNKQYKKVMLIAGGLILIGCIASSTIPRPSYLYLTQTVIHGVGSTLIIATCILIVGDNFRQKHDYHILATTLVSDGPLGIIIIGPFYAYLVGEYSWRVGFVIMGLIFLIASIVGSLTFVNAESSEYEEIDHENGSHNCDESHLPTHRIHWQLCSLAHITKNPQIFLWLAERLIQSIVSVALMINLTDYATENSNGKIRLGARINLFYGLGESVTFIMAAIIGDKLKGFLSYCYLLGAFMSVVILLLVQFEYTYVSSIMAVTFFLGLSMGIGNTAVYAVSEEVMNIRGPIGYSTSSLMTGIGMIFSTFFSGLIIDIFGYGGYFTCQAILMTIRLIILILINYILQERIKKADAEPTESTNKPIAKLPYGSEPSEDMKAETVQDEEILPINQQTNF